MRPELLAVPPDGDPLTLLGTANYVEFVNALMAHPAWGWTERWWQQGCLICMVTDGQTRQSWQQRDFGEIVPRNIDRLGCSGYDLDGRLFWLGFDLDVGHGSVSYGSLDEALADAQRLREELGEAEVRLSTTGTGVHVRHLLPEDSGLMWKEAGRLAKFIAKKLSLRADPSSLGRQAHWLWSRNPSGRSFELVAEQMDPVLDVPDIVVEALATSTATGSRGSWSGESTYDPDLADDSAEYNAIIFWEPAGEFVDRSPLGDRNWSDMRHLCNDWGLSIERAIEILRDRGADVHPDVGQWRRMLRYVRYPQGWARRREEGKRRRSRGCEPWGLLGFEGGAI